MPQTPPATDPDSSASHRSGGEPSYPLIRGMLAANRRRLAVDTGSLVGALAVGAAALALLPVLWVAVCCGLVSVVLVLRIALGVKDYLRVLHILGELPAFSSAALRDAAARVTVVAPASPGMSTAGAVASVA